jgi:hypothetical protein
MLSFIDASEAPTTQVYFTDECEEAVVVGVSHSQSGGPNKSLAEVYLTRLEAQALYAWLGVMLAAAYQKDK